MNFHKTLELRHVTVFRIPPGEVTLSQCNTEPSNIIWKGGLRVYETDTDVSNIPAKEAVVNGMQLKLELYNHQRVTLLLEDFAEVDSDVPWAEVWYNPRETESGYIIANDGSETISMIEIPAFYRIIAQLPDSGYHPVMTTEATKGKAKERELEARNKLESGTNNMVGSNGLTVPGVTVTEISGLSTLPSGISSSPSNGSPSSPSVLQVALGLHFQDKESACQFYEVLTTYRRRYSDFCDTYRYDAHLSVLQRRIMADLRVEDTLREPTPSDMDDDDFGSFVGASYD